MHDPVRTLPPVNVPVMVLVAVKLVTADSIVESVDTPEVEVLVRVAVLNVGILVPVSPKGEQPTKLGIVMLI